MYLAAPSREINPNLTLGAFARQEVGLGESSAQKKSYRILFYFFSVNSFRFHFDFFGGNSLTHQ
jgi:hypothetical protein